jgi:hypothetical protein
METEKLLRRIGHAFKRVTEQCKCAVERAAFIAASNDSESVLVGTIVPDPILTRREAGGHWNCGMSFANFFGSSNDGERIFMPRSKHARRIN